MKSILWALSLTLITASHGVFAQVLEPETSARATSTHDLSEDEASQILGMVFDGRPHQALAFVDSLEARSDGEPLFLLMRARCFQELVPMDDAHTGAARVISRPALEDLDRCIEVCSVRLDAGTDDALYLYRGWAWMAKAYVRSMTRDLFTAGREAKRGKKDLETYLQAHPGDPTATGILGAFLYFADTIPGAFKLLSKILFLPSGDRAKGLDYLETAAGHDGLLETDWKLILYNVYFYFEGRFEDGLKGLRDMADLHPAYGRTAIPLAASRPYAPHFAALNDRLAEGTVNRIYGGPHNEVDWNAVYLVQVFRAWGDRFCGHKRTSVTRLQSIIHESPRHPDWASGFARLELGRIFASQGRRDDASAMFESVLRGYSFDFLRKEAEILLEDLDAFAVHFEEPALPDTDEWVAELYRADPDSLPAIRSRFECLGGRSVAAGFYVAECDLLSGDFESARREFEQVISADAPAWDQAYQMFAATRIAEIYAARGSYKSAARYQDIAMNYYHSEYLLDWVMEGRKKYFERLEDGKAPGPPSLLTLDDRDGTDSRAGASGASPGPADGRRTAAPDGDRY